MPDLAILLPDIVDSTPLFAMKGDEAALAEIGRCLDMLRATIQRHGGRCVHTRGDDILSVFKAPSAAFAAARDILKETATGLLPIHAGLHYGRVIEARGVIFGEAVILCARLSALAKPGEVLTSRAFVAALGGTCPPELRSLDPVLPKGSTTRVPVYGMTVGPNDMLRHTTLHLGHEGATAEKAARDRQLRIAFNGTVRHVGAGQRLSFGRSPDCDLVAAAPWVSRQHAVLTFAGGRIELVDQSSLGTYVLLHDGSVFLVHREAVVLPVEGIISPVMKPDDPRAERLGYAVV